MGECKLCPLGYDPPQTPEQGTVLTGLIVNILSLLAVPVNGVSLSGQNKLSEVSARLTSEGKLIARAERAPDFIARAWRQNE